MPTVHLCGNSYTLSNTSYLRISNPGNMYTSTDSTTYAQLDHTRNNSTTSYYLYITGFDFSQVPSNATIISAFAKVKGLVYRDTYRFPYLTSNNSGAIPNILFEKAIDSTVDITSVDITSKWEIVKGTENCGIRLALGRSSRNQASYLRIYGAEFVVEYSLPGVTCSISYYGNTIATTTETGPVNITYKGSTIASNVTGTKTLNCNGKLMESNLVIGSKTLNCVDKVMASDVIVTVT